MQNQKYRSPVVVVLGHVDHGKTTLLDNIRKSNVAGKEVGAITQSIGAYQVKIPITGYHTDTITFIDTPGHQVFSQLRLRGAQVADIAILIIDGVDSVMPQTIESIAHIKQADIPFIVAVNKTDLPSANIEKVKKDLLKHEVLVEGMGGKIALIPISAKTGKGVNDLLEAILYISSNRGYTYDPSAEPQIYVIETQKLKSGPSVSCIIKEGQISVGNIIFNADTPVKIKALIDDLGKNIDTAIPSMPFGILGFNQLPEVGSLLSIKPVNQKQNIIKQPIITDSANFFAEEEKKLNIILKTDSQGSLEAIDNALVDNKKLEFILKSVGEINKSDIFLAKIAKALIIGFAIKTDKNTLELADQEKVIIKTYSIIYELLDELTEVSRLSKEKEEREKSIKGEAKIIASFVIEGERIAGLKVTKGKISTDDKLEIFRGQKLLLERDIASIKQKAKHVKEVKKNEDCGIVFSPPFDFQVGDVVKSYSI